MKIETVFFRTVLTVVALMTCLNVLFAQQTDEFIFSTRSGERGIVSVTKSKLKDNVFSLTFNLRWVDQNLKPVSDRFSVILLENGLFNINTPFVTCQSINKDNKRPLILSQKGGFFVFEVDERFPGGDVVIDLPFQYAASEVTAMDESGRMPFAFSRPRKLAVNYHIERERVADLTPPEIRILSPEGVNLGMKPILDTESVRIALMVRDNFGIDNVLVNNRPAQMVNDSTFIADVKLTIGYENPVNIIAVDNSGLESRTQFAVESRPVGSLSGSHQGTLATSTRREPSDVDINIPDNDTIINNRFALIIGNEDYRTYQPHLRRESNVDYAIHDAEIFSKYARKVLGVPESNIILLLNARSIEMNSALDRMSMIARNTEGDAEFFVYYAGHGFPDEVTREPYLIPVDVTGSNLGFAVRLSDFYAKLTEHPTRRTTVFIDACFSGGGRDQGLIAARAVRVRPRGPSISGNIVVFSAASGEQSALPYEEKQHGMFTYHLLSKLKETSGKISYQELSDFLRLNVGIRSVMVNHREQNPQTNISTNLDDSWKDWILTEF